MLGKYNVYFDNFSEVLELMPHQYNWPLPLNHDRYGNIVDGNFYDFSQEVIKPNSIYVIGRQQSHANAMLIRDIVENDKAKIVYSNPSEGSETIINQARHAGFEPYLLDGRMMAVSGGYMGPEYNHMHYDHFLPKVFDYSTNANECLRTSELYSKLDKPYKFLFLNGRNRPHRKWLLHYFKDRGLLDQCLWTNLDSSVGYNKDLPYIVDGVDKIIDPIPVKSLPPQYEIARYNANRDKEFSSKFIKNDLFDHKGQVEWGDIFIKAEPYIDTYFSVVTETVFTFPHSFRTEKIWKPIAFGQPWICAANQGFYQDLQRMGFKTFGNIIDESFDQEPNALTRITKLAEVVVDLCSSQSKLENFLLASQDICLYNQMLLKDLRFSVRSDFTWKFTNLLSKWTT